MTKQQLIHKVESQLPELAKAANSDAADNVVMHQDAFAADLSTQELALFGMAIKYLGLKGKNVTVVIKA